LSVKNLVKNYGKIRAVDNISFSIEPGICFGLLGPNGAGKTSTIEIIEGITQPTSGEIFYNNAPRNRTFWERIGVQFQSTELFSFLTVRESLQTFMRLYRNQTFVS
jgi:ABC-2 type transport system ATP-binding protein